MTVNSGDMFDGPTGAEGGGTASSRGSGVGSKRVFMNVLSRRDPVRGRSRWCLWMARSCKRIRRPPGPKGAESEGIGRSKGGLTRKVVALTYAVGHRIRFGILPGQTHDLKAVPELLDHLPCEMLMGDKAFDADGWLDTGAERGATAVIPPKSNRNTTRDCDYDATRERHRIETVFATIKEAHSLTTRYDKTLASFAAGIHLMAGVVAARSLSTGLNPSLTLCVFASIHKGPNFCRGTTSGLGGGTAAARCGRVLGLQTPVMRTLRGGGAMCVWLGRFRLADHRAWPSCGQGRSGRLFA